MDIGSYHGTYFRASGQRLIVNKPYLLADGLVLEFGKSVTKDDKVRPLLPTAVCVLTLRRHMSRCWQLSGLSTSQIGIGPAFW